MQKSNFENLMTSDLVDLTSKVILLNANIYINAIQAKENALKI